MAILIERKRTRRRRRRRDEAAAAAEEEDYHHHRTGHCSDVPLLADNPRLSSTDEATKMIPNTMVDHLSQSDRLRDEPALRLPTNQLPPSKVRTPPTQLKSHNLTATKKQPCAISAVSSLCAASQSHRPSGAAPTGGSSSRLFVLLSVVAVTLLMNLTVAPSVVVAAGQQTSQSTSTGQQPQQSPSSVIQTASTATTATTSMATSGRGKYRTMYACEDRQLTLDCNYGSKINLIRANFGRFSVSICNDQGTLDQSVDCMSPVTFRIMRDRCQDEQRCSVNATSMIFGDRCPKTRKYLEVHFQCQPDPRVAAPDVPDHVDLRNTSQFKPPPVFAQQPNTAHGSSPILPPNNPTGASRSHPFYQPDQTYPSTSPMTASLGQQPPAKQVKTVINSEIMSYNKADNYHESSLFDSQEPNQDHQLVVTMRHAYVDNMSNPRCFLWDQNQKQWTQQGSQILSSNLTHTICAFDQATSYLLVMDYLGPIQMISPTNEQQPVFQPAQPSQVPPSSIPMDNPVPGILEHQPVVLDPQQPQPSPVIVTPQPFNPRQTINVNSQQQQQGQQATAQQSSSRLFPAFGYLFALFCVAVVFVAIAFIASSMRSSAGAALKSLGNFPPFNGPKYKGRRQDGHHSSSLHHSNKDLLVINNQNGHQFLYAPASTTKISSSSSTHILSTNNAATLGGPTHGTLHHLQQRLYSDNGGTLSNLSATGAQSNNYYYGLMGLFQHQQQQQQQHQFNQQLHLNQQHVQQQQQQSTTSYTHQANKSTLSQESANSSSSSSGVESGSTSMQQQQQHQPQAMQACLVTMNNDYNLMGHHLTAATTTTASNYGQSHNLFNATNLSNTVGGANGFSAQQQQQPTLTLNAHYSSSGAGGMQTTISSNPAMGNQHMRQMSNAMREHIYECVDDDKPAYMARLLMPMSNEQQQFGTLGHQQQHQQHPQHQLLANSRTMTLSSRLLQDALNQQQHQQQQLAGNNNNNSNQKRAFNQPSIVRDSQGAKTNIICSKLAQIPPQRATELGGKTSLQQQQHEATMASIFSSADSSTANV